MTDAAARMDAIYRVQRHFYDMTRKPYLLGRDALIEDLCVPAGGSILEVGCGTGRNLLSIARRYPGRRCYGLDVSSAMLQTARRNIEKSSVRDVITLARADANTFAPQSTFGVHCFDRVVFSYVLSMIPGWESVLHSAHAFLAPGGRLHVVDFGNQTGLPKWFRAVLNHWLSLFDVTPRFSLEQELSKMAAIHESRLSRRSIWNGYALVASLEAVSKG